MALNPLLVRIATGAFEESLANRKGTLHRCWVFATLLVAKSVVPEGQTSYPDRAGAWKIVTWYHPSHDNTLTEMIPAGDVMTNGADLLQKILAQKWDSTKPVRQNTYVLAPTPDRRYQVAKVVSNVKRPAVSVQFCNPNLALGNIALGPHNNQRTVSKDSLVAIEDDSTFLLSEARTAIIPTNSTGSLQPANKRLRLVAPTPDALPIVTQALGCIATNCGRYPKKPPFRVVALRMGGQLFDHCHQHWTPTDQILFVEQFNSEHVYEHNKHLTGGAENANCYTPLAFSDAADRNVRDRVYSPQILSKQQIQHDLESILRDGEPNWGTKHPQKRKTQLDGIRRGFEATLAQWSEQEQGTFLDNWARHVQVHYKYLPQPANPSDYMQFDDFARKATHPAIPNAPVEPVAGASTAPTGPVQAGTTVNIASAASPLGNLPVQSSTGDLSNPAGEASSETSQQADDPGIQELIQDMRRLLDAGDDYANTPSLTRAKRLEQMKEYFEEFQNDGTDAQKAAFKDLWAHLAMVHNIKLVFEEQPDSTAEVDVPDGWAGTE